MYVEVGTEPAPQRNRWTSSPDFRIYRCSHCRALLVLRESYDKPPAKCGKCKQ